MGSAERVDGIVAQAQEAQPVRRNPMAQASHVPVQIENRVATLVLDRPPLNVMNISMMQGIHEAIVDLAGQCDLLVFRGAGAKGFSAGADIADHAPDRVASMLKAFHGIFRELWRSPIVTIAAVHGVCLGGGCELATFCDFVVAANSARFGQPEIKLGCFPPVAMVTFPTLMGMRAALDLILSGRIISAAEAQELGLVSRVVSDDELESGVAQLVHELRSLSPTVLAITRRKLWSAGFNFEGSLEAIEDLYLQGLMKTHDAKEGIRAFLEKREPTWQAQ